MRVNTMRRPSSFLGSHGFSRRAFLAALGLSGMGALTGRAAGGSSAESGSGAEILKQRGGEGACGPCAIGNALLRGDAASRRAFGTLPGATGDARLDALVARYGAKPSETYGAGRARFVAGLGITNDDLAFLANDFFHDAGLPAVRGQWLDQSGGEGGVGHVRRVHGLFRAALARGLPPVVEIRSFAADPSSSKEPWINLSAHWLALASVESELAAEPLGFACRFADSSSGRVIPAFVSAEIFRPFSATRGFKLRPDGNKDWNWITGHPYLLLNVPDLPMYANTRPPSARTLIALTYVLQR